MPSREARRDAQESQRALKAAATLVCAASTTFWLIRHGETDWNLERRLQGQTQPGPPLNALGVQQAHALAAHLATTAGNSCCPQHPCTHIYASDLLRAVQTADILAQQLLLPVVQRPDLRERNLGVLTGLTYATAPQLQPGAWAQLQAADRATRIDGGGESLEELQQRAVGVVQELADAHPGQTILVVSHGGFLQSLHHAVRRYSSKSKLCNCSISVLRVPTRPAGAAAVVRHVEAVAATPAEAAAATVGQVEAAAATTPAAAAAAAMVGQVKAAATTPVFEAAIVGQEDAAAGFRAVAAQADGAAHAGQWHSQQQQRKEKQQQQQLGGLVAPPRPSSWALLEWNSAEHLQQAGVAGESAGFGGGARDA